MRRSESKTLMVQGTGSHVGKSIMVAGLCRYFYRRGYKVCPFKTQNMALNSFVTGDGGEMGRAQVVQAEAAGLQPDVRMNPILIKPVSDCKAQVIFMGSVVDNMSATEYDNDKKNYIEKISKVFEGLRKEFDLIIIEGAGSPAEINLLENDIVNMRTAEFTKSPVVIVGDIDKGGVFASFYGTVKILPEKYQRYIKGFIINKFRGDKTLLYPGLEWLEAKMSLPVLGVVPYYKDIVIEEEDSVNLERQRELLRISKGNKSEKIKVGVAYLQHISNFTDFSPLEIDPRVQLYYFKSLNELLAFDTDLIIIPGSKSTIKDLGYILSSGIADEIKKRYKKGVSIIGICGGYQMLGRKLIDRFVVESDIKSARGLGLLGIDTEFFKTKKTVQARFNIHKEAAPILGLDKAVSMEGYEIHMGKTVIDKDHVPLFRLPDGQSDGVILEDSRKQNFILGTYIHGIFDNIDFREAVIKKLFNHKKNRSSSDAGKGEVSYGYTDYKGFKESQYDNLAGLLEKNLDMKLLQNIIEEGI